MRKRRIRYDVKADAQPLEQPGPEALPEESSVYARGQTVVPKTIREALRIEYGARLQWEIREGVIQVTPIPKHPAAALRGALRGSGITFESFMQARKAERQREREREQRWQPEAKHRGTS